ncbi:hypothetical protein [Shewanella surugensis]|uniref:DUF481 domain-containing protein n=1 Tax=Shewanella surugensis TaxID=212020 RepID=A0ABT0L696_9GAMM|nr:hypothetical protein [Shewanella surugensis]MCL1123211.1 hypothetical protein [Shewanella surugensis]
MYRNNLYFSMVYMITLVCIIPSVFMAPALSNDDKLNRAIALPIMAGHDDIFRQKRSRVWYRKINYYVDLSQEVREIELSRDTHNTALKDSQLHAQYDATILSLTAGGNLLTNTSVHLDLAYEQLTMEGEVIDINQSDYRQSELFTLSRNKMQTELFVEYDLGGGYTLGGDVYYGESRYKDNGDNQLYRDREMGAGLMFSRQFYFDSADLTLEYIFSHRQVLPGDKAFETQSRNFHNLLNRYRYRWGFDFILDVFTRVSYYPEYDAYNFWDTSLLYSFGSELTYQLGKGMRVSLRAERTELGEGDYINTFFANFEYQFGLNKGKRRLRRRKTPQLLIR